MMRKFFLTLIMFFSLPLLHAGDYDYLSFVTSEGTEQVLSEGLVMTVSGGNLIVSNGSTNLTLSLSKLQKMYFCDVNGVYSGLSDIDAEDSVLEVFSMEGKLIGTFDNMAQAVTTLAKGSYVVKKDANVIKILVP